MKKFLSVFAIALAAFAACEEPAPVEVPDELELKSEPVVSIGTGSEIVSISFVTNKSWTAKSESDFIVVNPTSGEAGEVTVKATVQSLPEDLTGRVGAVTLTVGGITAPVTIYQGNVFIIEPAELSVGIEGGDASFKVISNLDYEVKTYDSFDWAPATFDKNTGEGTFKVAANNGYDARSAYIKFTIPAIQDAVIDDETGEPTGETQDHVERIYVYQAGNSKVEWCTMLNESFNVGDGATASVAIFDGKLLVSDGLKVHVVNPSSGKIEGELATGDLPVQSIACDDAGNLLLANLGAYGALFDVYAVKAGDSKLANPVNLIHCVVEAWSGSTGVDKVAARGDVFGNGIVSAIYGGVPSYGGVHYGLYWGINGGKAAEQPYNEWNPIVNQPDGGWFQLPLGGDDLWLSNRAAFIPAGTSAADGFFFGGYDGTYNINYFNGSEWIVSVPAAGDWAGGPQGMHATVWNGKKILAAIQMGYTWWSDGWGMPAYLWILDVTNPANPTVLSKASYAGENQIISGDTENSTVDVLPVVDGSDLVTYLVDTSKGLIGKVRFPAL